MADPLVTKGKAKRDQFPIAPFDTDLNNAIAGAFDSISGEPIDVSRLQTYQEALLGYPFRSEPKFLNGQGYDTGRTERCHVHACAVQFIGKEADRWEEEHIIGNRLGETAIAYGVDPLASARLYHALRTGIAAVGKTKVAAATGIARKTLNKIERGEAATTTVPLGRVHRALEKLMAECSAIERERFRKKTSLIQMVKREGGIRAAARKLGVDASNLRRLIIEMK
jgi:transcriptional regulator with XRE-family HTH domain